MAGKLRLVPKDWHHPINPDGTHKPLFDKYYIDALNEWMNKHIQWESGTHPDLIERPELKGRHKFLALWEGNPPDVEFYRRRRFDPIELTHMQYYEETTEGTPKSPVFAVHDLESLAGYMVENEEVMKIEDGECVPFTWSDWCLLLSNNLKDLIHDRDAAIQAQIKSKKDGQDPDN